MNNLVDVSAIIPAYDKADMNELHRCFRSIFSNSILPKEIIVIENGDNFIVSKITKKFKKKYSGDIYTLYFKNNVGYAKAVNQAILKSKSKFLTFIDMDDTVERNFFNFLYLKISQTSSDFVKVNFNIINKNKKTTSKGIGIIKSKWDLLKYHPSIWSSIYSRSFIIKNKIFFPESDDIWVDNIFQIKCLNYSSKMSYYNEDLYNYMYNQNNGCSNIKNNTVIVFNTLFLSIKLLDKTTIHKLRYRAILNLYHFFQISSFREILMNFKNLVVISYKLKINSLFIMVNSLFKRFF